MSSPAVLTNEVDLTLNLKTAGVAGAATVGAYVWGDVEKINNLGDIDELELYHGKPTNTNFVDWFSTANLFSYTSNVKTVRVINTATAKNSSVSDDAGTGLLIKNSDHFEIVNSSTSNTEFFVAKSAGVLGDTLAVYAADSSTFTGWDYETYFDTAPGNSEGSEIFNAASDDEMHIVVVDRLGKITGTPGAVLETYPFVSKAIDGKDVNGNPSYYKNILNKKSAWIWALKPISGDSVVAISTTHTAIGGTLAAGKPLATLAADYVGELGSGNDGTTPAKTDYLNAWALYSAIDDVDNVAYVTGGAGGDLNHADVVNAVIALASNQKNRVAFYSPKISDAVGVSSALTIRDNILDTLDLITTKNSYGHMDTGVGLQFDKYNNVYRWIPCNAEVAGLYLEAHNTIGPWVSAAGYNRGKLKNIIQLAYNPDKPSRDILYKKNVNSIITEKSEGTLLFGDKTLQAKNSAFTFMGTRYLFIHLRTIISDAAKFQLFESNDQFTRSAFVTRIDPFLRQIKGQRGIDDYFVLCDERNNTAKVIQDGYFVGDIFVKPQYSTQWVKLNFTAINRDVSFEEVISAQFK